MQVVFNDFQVLRENDKTYFHILESVINSVDELSILEVRKNRDNYSFRLSISESGYIVPLIRELNAMHNKFNIKVDFSKSIKSSAVINFKINLIE